ncbi:LuxR family transcriptional regulator [Roseicyclus marinus]|jgi:DNA-binding CsgD family transcriptional regulator|uniref:LuxR family transcriptional regulator n=1 Tax=Roseicyclus marinus TaxID=2161673 RepID=A0AA48H547_9RHOB|nr:LuxR family transcriptional regulator [Roseicyclus marinus]
MMRGLSENPAALAALILAQAACAGVFLFDVVLDGGELTRLWPLDWHFGVEAAAVLGLIAGIAFEIRVLLRLLARKAHLERQVSMAASALHDVIEAHFRKWGLTASEHDVAWFTVKGLPIAEIARLRGSAEGTVKSHLNAIYRKAGVTNRGELLSLLIEDLMDSPDPAPLPQALPAGG